MACPQIANGGMAYGAYGGQEKRIGLQGFGGETLAKETTWETQA